MKRLRVFLIAVALFLMLSVRLHSTGTTYYVDAACPSAGTGTSINCGASGPKTDIPSGIALLSGADDVLNIRGIHGSHGSCPGDSLGIYSTGDQISITKSGTSGHPILIQNNGYAGTLGSGEVVYIDGTAAIAGGWTQCSDCSGGSAQTACRNVPGTCSQAWFAADGAGAQKKASAAQKDDGTIAYKVARPGQCSGAATPFACCTGSGTGCGLSDLTNAHAGYAGTSPEIDCAQPDGTTNGEAITCKWGASLPARPYVMYDNNGFGFLLNSSTWLNIQGLNFRMIRRAAIDLGSSSNVGILNNTFKYITDINGNGSDHAVSSAGSNNNATISGNEGAYIGSEAIHTQAAAAGATVYTITGNWLHDSGDQNVLGQGAVGTPSMMILGDHGGGAGNGDYTGSVVSGNIVGKTNSPVGGGSPGRGIILENVSSNWIIRDNVFIDNSAECIKLDSTGGHTDGNQIFNNLFVRCGPNGTTGAAILLFTNNGGSSLLDGNKIYNNTFIDPAADAIDETCNTAGEGKCTNNLIRNNLFYLSSGWHKMINWFSTTSSNVQEYNLTYGPGLGGNDAQRWKNVTYTCATIGTSGTGNICADPLFVNFGSSDYHIQGGSPAKDAGTATGMPAGRTRDINNTIASAHSLPAYSDNQAQIGGAWDIGADEQGGVAGTPALTLTKSSTPNPVLIGSNLTYTLAYSNTGTGGVTGAVLTDTVPTNTTFVSATGGGSLGGGVVTWTIGSIAAGANGSVQMVVQVSGSITPGTAILNTTYSLASNELATVTGTTITTSTNPPTTPFIYPLSQRPTTWPQIQTFPAGISFAGGACPATCTPPLLCANTSPALCFCTSTNTYTKVSGGGSCP